MRIGRYDTLAEYDLYAFFPNLLCNLSKKKDKFALETYYSTTKE